MKIYVQILTRTRMFLEALLVGVKGGNNTNVHQLMDKQNMVCPADGVLLSHRHMQQHGNMPTSRRSQGQKALYMKCPE